MSQNLRNYTKALYTLDAVVRRTPAHAWDKPSPCDQWTAREVLGHFMWGVKRVTAVANGDALPVEQAEADVAGPDPVAAWSLVRDAVFVALDQQGALDKAFHGPFGPGTIDGFLSIHTLDGTVHAWDIAKTAGIDGYIPTELAEAGVAGITAAGDGIRRPGLFSAALTVPADADAVTRFIAISGRNPN
jgi:uncharacterized protein (TIGR03086 family)